MNASVPANPTRRKENSSVEFDELKQKYRKEKRERIYKNF